MEDHFVWLENGGAESGENWKANYVGPCYRVH